jgi:hypothetical protein
MILQYIHNDGIETPFSLLILITGLILVASFLPSDTGKDRGPDTFSIRYQQASMIGSTICILLQNRTTDLDLDKEDIIIRHENGTCLDGKDTILHNMIHTLEQYLPEDIWIIFSLIPVEDLISQELDLVCWSGKLTLENELYVTMPRDRCNLNMEIEGYQ